MNNNIVSIVYPRRFDSNYKMWVEEHDVVFVVPFRLNKITFQIKFNSRIHIENLFKFILHTTHF